MNQKEKDQWILKLSKTHKDMYLRCETVGGSNVIKCDEGFILFFALNEKEDAQHIVDTHNTNILCGVYT